MQKLEGDGMAFVHAGGAIHEKHYNRVKFYVWIQDVL